MPTDDEARFKEAGCIRRYITQSSAVVTPCACPLLAPSRSRSRSHACLLSGVDLKWLTCGQIDANDPDVWSGRAKQEDSTRRWQAVLHQCIRPLIGASCSGLIMDISAPAFSLPERPQRTIWVTRFRMRREDRTSISFSSSRRPWRVNEVLATATRLEACWPRRCDCEPARSMRCARAC
jgi:hypothetical protein